MAVFRQFLQLARRLQFPWHDHRMVRWPGSREIKMSISSTNLHQVLLSVVGALVASSLFLSAAVSSAPVI